MSKIDDVFKKLGTKKALIPFITGGFPNFKFCRDLIFTLEDKGADIIELGIPFSDPMADGPVIQKSSEIALKNKASLKKILEWLSGFEDKLQTPIVLMGYVNPFLQFGYQKLASQFSKLKNGAGILTVDMPFENAADVCKIYRSKNIDPIFLLTPTSKKERIQKAARDACGYVYYVSITGITGQKIKNTQSIQTQIKKIKQKINLPVCVGFGISTTTDVKRVKPYCDGVIVGSRLIQILIDNPQKKAQKEVGQLIAQFKKALD